MEQRQEYLASLTSGDEVLLLSGIHGKIISIKDDLVSLQIAKGVVIYVEKESVSGKTKELLLSSSFFLVIDNERRKKTIF